SRKATDVMVQRVLGRFAQAHAFDHAAAQLNDGRLAHRGAPGPEIEAWSPLHPQAQALHIPLTAMICLAAADYCHRLPPSRCMTQSGTRLCDATECPLRAQK